MEIYSDVYYPKVQCEECGEYYNKKKWCKLCQIRKFKNVVNTLNWSENEKINDFVQERLEIRLVNVDYHTTVFEWIPYNQLNCVEEIEKGTFATVYSAIWKDGLYYDKDKK